jgi:ribosome maturation factor RimP
VTQESDWKAYYGSEIEIKKILAEGKHNEFERVILKLVDSKKLLTYFETKYQFVYEVLEHPDKWMNNNILGKFYSKDLLDPQK